MTKLTRADRFLDEMNRAVPWAELVGIVAASWDGGEMGRKATDVELLLRLHCPAVVIKTERTNTGRCGAR